MVLSIVCGLFSRHADSISFSHSSLPHNQAHTILPVSLSHSLAICLVPPSLSSLTLVIPPSFTHPTCRLHPSPSRRCPLHRPRRFVPLFFELFFLQPKRTVDERVGVSSLIGEETPCRKRRKALSTQIRRCRVRTSVATTTCRMVDVQDCFASMNTRRPELEHVPPTCGSTVREFTSNASDTIRSRCPTSS